MATKSTRSRPRSDITNEELARTTTRALAKKYGLTSGQIYNLRAKRGVRMLVEAVADAYQERDESRPSVSQNAPPEFDEDSPDPTTPEAFEELWRAVRDIKAVERKFDPRRHKIGITLPTDKPVGLVFSGDWQLGSEGVDYDLWREDMALFWENHVKDPGSLYGIGMGDYTSALGTLNIRGAQYRDLIRPGYQIGLARGLFRMTKGFWLVLLAGCHDTFTNNASDQDTIADYVALAGARHGWHGVEANLKVGFANYVLRLRHRYRFNSSLNPLNAQRRQAEMEGAADVIAHAHFHTSLIGDMPAAGQDSVMLRSGSYQIHDSYARQYVGNVKADARFPMVIFWPEKKKLWSVRDYREGLDYLASLRRAT